MAFDPPDGILDIGNATLRVGKLEVAETSGLNQGLQNIVKNDLLITENTEYTTNNKWGLKLPTTWVAEFEVKGHSGKYIDFNFYNENSASNAQGYNLTFMDTTMTLRYDGGSALGGGAATIPTIVGAYRKVNIFFERGVISVSIDGTRYLYHKESDGFNQGLGVASRVVSATGSAFVNVFIESDNENNSKFKNLRIVNGRFISDKTSNIAFIGGNLGVGVHSPKETLDIRGNMHLTRVSNVSQIKVESNVVAEYTGPHNRPLRKYPEIILPRSAVGAEYNGYRIDRSSEHVTSAYLGVHMAFSETAVDFTDSWGAGFDGTNFSYSASTGEHTTYLTGGTTQGTAARLASNVPNGEWVSLKNPVGIKLDDVELRSRNASDWYSQYPTDFQFWGSNDGTTWSHIKTFTGQCASGQSTLHRYHINSTIFYNRHALVVTKIPGTASTIIVSSAERHFHLSEIRFNGYEEGSGSLDTTLKTVYNVPATTGTQLEVYYDGQDYSDMPTVGSASVIDKAGGDQNGTPGTGVTFDSTYKAFVFDASGSGTVTTSKITSSTLPSTFVDDAQHSVAIWFKIDTITGDRTLFTIKDNTSGVSYQTPHAVVDSNGILRYDFWSNNIKLLDQIAANEWYHLVITFSGGNHQSGTKFYINGVHNTNVSTPSATVNLDIQVNSVVYVGGSISSYEKGIDGSIANFRLYSKALNADQVKELYDYQKDYFLGSKSQVTLYKGHLGVGVAEPSGQLELAGDERLQEYPPRAMTANETLVEGHGDFVTHGGSSSATFAPWRAFNKELGSAGNFWIDTGVGYSSTAPYEALSTHSRTALYDGSVLSGGWIDLICPYPIKLSSVSIAPRTNYWQISLQKGVILGSNNGEDWYQIDTINYNSPSGSTGTSAISNQLTNFSLASTSYYSHIRLVCTHLTSQYGSAPNYDMHWQMGALVYFGTPGPTTLDKGSLSLTRSLDVPRVSRYDVDTETPRPEKLVLDYDTTVNSSPTDISGNAVHGTFFNGATYDDNGKAFSFNNTQGGIRAQTTNFDTSGKHSFVAWMKFYSFGHWYGLYGLGTKDGSASNFTIYTGAGGSLGATDGFRLESRGGGRYDDRVWSESQKTNKWYHVAVTWDGTGGLSNVDMYIDLVKLARGGANASATSSITLPTDRAVRIGADAREFHGAGAGSNFNGLISNPKFYSEVLEFSEIKKLYNLGRTGRSMVISDTAVGIGKAPEAQLDVRGNINYDGVIKSKNPIAFAVYRDYINNNSRNHSYTGNALFNTVHYNYGGHFDIGDSKFIVPVKGLYHFGFSAYTNQSAGTQSRLKIMVDPVDGGSTTYLEQKGFTIQMHGNSINTNAYCDAGDKIWLSGNGTSQRLYMYTQNGHNRFYGYLIYAL